MMILKKNVGNTDSIIRVVIGALMVILGLYFENFWGFLGFILVFSGAVSFCPVYRLLKMETTKPNIERAN
jgi:hypothetical protein